MGICCLTQELGPVICDDLEGGMGQETGGRFKREETHVNLWLIHVDVWQKPTQHCKAITLQLKINFLKKEMEDLICVK